MNQKLKSKKSSEWVGAPACAHKANTSETFTPFDRGLHLSERELRLRERTKRIEEQAANDKSASGKAIGSTMTFHQNEAKSNEFLNSLTQPALRRKMSSDSQPESPHSVAPEFFSEQLPSSLEDVLRPEIFGNDYSTTYTHQKRVSNSTNISRKMEIKINFPSPNDKIWNKVNADLEQIIPSVFPTHTIDKLSSSDLSQKFDHWLHAFFLERFGPLPISEKNKTQSRKPRTNKALQHLRKRKKECKAARNAILKAGLANSPEAQMISKEWLSLVCQHNKLRVELNKKQQTKARIAAENTFRKNPHNFASKLFDKVQKSDKPAFSAEIAQNYFEQTYRDENREHTYSPLPDFQRPDLPSYLFSLRCPTTLEMHKSIRKKRNGAKAGFNGITTVPYKKCQALIDFIIKLGRKIWKSKNIPIDWAQAYIILLSKSNELTVVSEFRPIAIASTSGKIFFSVLSHRLQMYMIKNCFISRNIQKGFLFGISGCIEHTFALFEALRDAKQRYRQIVITWLDLANAYAVFAIISFNLH